MQQEYIYTVLYKYVVRVYRHAAIYPINNIASQLYECFVAKTRLFVYAGQFLLVCDSFGHGTRCATLNALAECSHRGWASRGRKASEEPRREHMNARRKQKKKELAMMVLSTAARKAARKWGVKMGACEPTACSALYSTARPSENGCARSAKENARPCEHIPLSP